MAGGVSSDRPENADAANDERRSTPTGSERRGSLGAYAQLVRLPNLFTAPPDVILGAALVAVAGSDPSPIAVAGVALASVLLYAGGTTLNDAFDAPIDARERPERPIPAGHVSRPAAFGFGFGLLAVAVGVAFVAAAGPGAIAAGLVAAAVVAYDGLLKGTAAGFLAMGATRGLNVLLGTTAAGSAVLAAPARVLAVSAVVTAYIATVTFMADSETEGGNRGAVAAAGGGAAVAVLAVGWYLVALEPPPLETGVAIGFAAAFCWWVGRPLRTASADPVSSTVGPAVGACVLGLVLLDTAFAAAAGVRWAAAVAVFLVPAVGLSRVFDVT
ncbi:UbiA family prenyltransferase [Haloarchaeobius amylolyticus]|uniref:UbiA family prenyltransferase n=1 Tax=Haloarchaeobius amylolyticus TaxID=1198296 RepID=A0ABD6BB85_9EURY